MDLKQLQEEGGFVSPTPVVKEVTWKDRTADDGSALPDVTFTIHVKKLSFGTIDQLFVSDDKDAERSRMSAYIAAAVGLGDDGKQRLSYEKAYQLKPGLARALMEAIGEVNETTSASGADASEKNSQPPTNSGAT